MAPALNVRSALFVLHLPTFATLEDTLTGRSARLALPTLSKWKPETKPVLFALRMLCVLPRHSAATRVTLFSVAVVFLALRIRTRTSMATRLVFRAHWMRIARLMTLSARLEKLWLDRLALIALRIVIRHSQLIRPAPRVR